MPAFKNLFFQWRRVQCILESLSPPELDCRKSVLPSLTNMQLYFSLTVLGRRKTINATFSLAARSRMVTYPLKTFQWVLITSRLKPKELSMVHKVLQVKTPACHSRLIFYHSSTNTRFYTQLYPAIMQACPSWPYQFFISIIFQRLVLLPGRVGKIGSIYQAWKVS